MKSFTSRGKTFFSIILFFCLLFVYFLNLYGSDHNQNLIPHSNELDRIEINGPSELPLNTTYEYQATAFYTNGSSAIVNAEWSLTLEPYLYETFNSYSNQQMLEAVWPPLVGDGLTLTDERSYNGNGGRSVKADHIARANVRNLNTGYHGTDEEPLVLEFWLYDSEPTLTNSRHFISLAAWSGSSWGSGDLENLAAMGIYNSPVDGPEYYKVRTVEGGSNWATGTIARSEGWRHMQIRILSDTVEYSVDNQLTFTDTYDPPATGWNSIRLGSGLISTHEYEVYYDNIKLYSDITPDAGIAQISPGGQLTTYGTPAIIRVLATYTEGGITRNSTQVVNIGTGIKVAAPVFSPSPGTFSTSQNVLISSATQEAMIHYTTDGTDPSTSGTVTSGDPGESLLVNIPMSSTIEIRAYATRSEWQDSDETSGTYIVEPALTALQITGPSELKLNWQYQYTARAFYSDGTDELVSGAWELIFPDTITVFQEDFTGYLNQEDFESSWTPGVEGGLLLSDVQARSTISASQDQLKKGNYHALLDSYQGSDELPLVFEFWMYDSDASLTNARHFISLASYSGEAWGAGTLENLVALGIHNSPDAPTKYKARTVSGDSNWVATSIDRSTGWRKMTIRLLASTVEYYVDGSQAYQGPYTVPATGWNSIRLGSDLTSIDEFTVYYDELSIYYELDGGYLPAEISASGELTTGHLPGEAVLRVSYTYKGNPHTASMNITIIPETILVTGLSIQGETEIERNTDYQYLCEATYSDNSTAFVAPDRWFIRYAEDFSDDFSAYNDQSALIQSWPLLSESIDPLILDASLQPPINSGKSVRQDEKARALIFNMAQPLFVTEEQPLVFSFWLHDAHSYANNIRNFISFASFGEGDSWESGAPENLISFGVINSPSSNKYNIRIIDGGSMEHPQGWDECSMVRKKGWSFVEIHLSYPGTCTFYVNGSQVYQNTYSEPESGWNSIRIGSGLASTHIHTMSYSAITMGRKPGIEISQAGILHIDDNGSLPDSYYISPYLIIYGSGESQNEEYEIGAVYTENNMTSGGLLNISVPPASVSDWSLY